ncbi:MAG TPA: hydroxyquinol 1,2-dioxygenase [Gammaproteobacteria bacterium]|nr:hydroxyquinol 1,2-dioxygenase [Gammaproteobacteria bacterium]
MSSSAFKTIFGSLEHYARGEIELIDDDPKNYAFSNVFEVAERSAPYEKVVVAKSLEYVIETLRAEGTSPWFAAPHDEFALIMDGTVAVDLVKLDAPERVTELTRAGSVVLPDPPRGRTMGFMHLRRGHLALLPNGTAYRFRAERGVGVIVLQTLAGPASVQRWAQICRT